MGLEGELKHEEDEVERKLIHEIVKHLPVVPDQARHALCQCGRDEGVAGRAPTCERRAATQTARRVCVRARLAGRGLRLCARSHAEARGGASARQRHRGARAALRRRPMTT
jgi:hypothetical protein